MLVSVLIDFVLFVAQIGAEWFFLLRFPGADGNRGLCVIAILPDGLWWVLADFGVFPGMVC